MIWGTLFNVFVHDIYSPYGIYEYTTLCIIPFNVINAILTYHTGFMDTRDT